MRRNILHSIALAGVLAFYFASFSHPISEQAASGDAPHIGEGGLPQFQVDPNFPKVPSKWRMGFGSAVAIDNEDNVWILSRPRGLSHPRSTAPDLTSTPAPPVMEFDNDGNFLQGWGGESGPGYQWPSNEHSITVDYKGFVWIVGNADGEENNPAHLPNDNQILKFTKDGKFVMAIGKSGQTGSNATEVLRGASGLRVYPKTNELFVSDGYGNSRIMVYDADTGQFKRMFGAYGNRPLDIDARPPVPEPKPNEFCPMMCGIWPALQQFAVPHDVIISDDGLVYVSDRGNKRIQAFTVEGKFIAEQYLGLDSRYPLQARSAAFSPDERFLYVAGTPVTYILNRKTLEVLGSLDVGAVQTHPPGHQIATDHKGNIYEVQADLTGANGKSGGAGAYKFVFKGYSPKTTCPPCQSTRSPIQ
jgi:DNA-binding beta-propeller fold protein YncE